MKKYLDLMMDWMERAQENYQPGQLVNLGLSVSVREAFALLKLLNEIRDGGRKVNG